jgi:GTP-binding protein LepA
MMDETAHRCQSRSYQCSIRAAVGGKTVRQTVHAMRKYVTAKCYGDDATCKRKLLDKQKKGKARCGNMGT